MSILSVTVMKCRLKTRFPVVVVVFISVPAQGPICSLRVIGELVIIIHHCVQPDTRLSTVTTSNRLKSRGESINSLYLPDFYTNLKENRRLGQEREMNKKMENENETKLNICVYISKFRLPSVPILNLAAIVKEDTIFLRFQNVLCIM